MNNNFIIFVHLHQNCKLVSNINPNFLVENKLFDDFLIVIEIDSTVGIYLLSL